MHPFRLVILGFFIFALSACTSVGQRTEAIPDRDLDLSPGQGITVQVNSGRVTISGTESSPGRVHITGKFADPQRTVFQVLPQSDLIAIEAKYSPRLFSSPGVPIELEIQVPPDIPVAVTTFDAGVAVRDLRGKVAVNSTAGNITAENLHGQISLRSARGNVQASNCSGDLSVVGEAGLLSILDAHGKVGSTTIMGTIRWNGVVKPGDAINLETDHGPVEVLLANNSDVTLSANTISGDLLCPTKFSSTTRVCNGSLGSGMGAVKTRTVSGRLSVQIMP